VTVAEAGTSWIDGEWAPERGRSFERANPADRSDVMGPFYAAEAADVDRAVTGARRAQRDWGATPAPLRGDVLMRAAAVVRERADAIAQVLTREEGKTLAESKGEVLGGARILEFLGAGGAWGGDGRTVDSLRPTTMLYTRRHPLGVVAAITPWNFPFSNPCIKLGAALAAGNAVIWKPASWTPQTAVALTGCLVDAGVPPGVLNTLLGEGGEVGAQIVAHSDVKAVSFTGSTEVGRRLASRLADRGARAQLEMGGKNALVVLEDADVEAAVQATVWAAFASAGQKCTAVSRAIVLPAVREPFLARLVEVTRDLGVGDPTDPATDVGPVIHERPLDEHLAAIEDACRAGARLVEGGARLDGEGNYMTPAILDGVAPESRIAQEEIFGPVLAVIDAPDYEAALAITNETTYGLSASVYTRSLPLAMDFAERCDVGVVKVNEPPPGLDPHVPTGGWKDSGAGDRELGPDATRFFSEEKTVYLNHLGACTT
jgi:aldehyde dehydrogenase (NAD+)